MNGASLRAALLVLCMLISAACVASAPEDDAVTLRTDDERIIYSLGVTLGLNNRGVHALELTPREAAILREGLMDVMLERELQVAHTDYEGEFQPFIQRRAAALAKRERAASEPFLAAAEAEEGAERLPSGAILKRMQEGGGERPIAELPTSALVQVRVEGRRRDGVIFARTPEDQPPTVVRMTQMLPCWREALQEASIGSKLQVTCPTDTAYGDQGQVPEVKPGAAVAFEIEVVGVIDRE